MRLTTGQRIKARRKELGLSVDEVADQLGKNRATVYRYESDEIDNLPINILPPLARVLRVSPAWLLGWPECESVKRIPMLGSIAAGEPIIADETYGEYVEIGDGVKVDFCLRVKGDSMIDARIKDGDLVFVRQQPVVENGEIAAVMIDDEVTLKRFYATEDGVILKPENPKYQPKFYSRTQLENIRILGKAVLFQSVL